MSTSWHSYPSIYNLGHSAVKDLLTVPVNVEEKIDGSQFSFSIQEDGGILVRSKGCVMITDSPEKMFTRAVETVKALAAVAHPGWTYRCEFLAKPKHNTLAYDRCPEHNLIVFDINTAEEAYLSYGEKEVESARLGLECVALLYSGMVSSADQLRSHLDRQSVLGGQKVEGVVVKPRDYAMFGPDKKVLMGKFVSEAFKEIHGAEWRKSNPTHGDVILELAGRLTTAARWNKSVLHLAERGLIENSPRDIGKLIPEIQADVEKESAEEIKDALYRWAWPQIRRMVTYGMPEWYKEQLLKRQFNSPELEAEPLSAVPVPPNSSR